jgi:hypothetical protein
MHTLTSNHLEEGTLYLDCLATWIPHDEEKLQGSLKLLNQGSALLIDFPPLEGFIGLDEHAMT